MRILASLFPKSLKFCEIRHKLGAKFGKDLQNLLSLLKFSENCVKFCEKWCKGPEKSEKFGMVQKKKCRARKTLKNATLDAKIGVDTAENEQKRNYGRPSYRDADSSSSKSTIHFAAEVVEKCSEERDRRLLVQTELRLRCDSDSTLI